ncbi:RimK family alpha-L-glutamate ligase [Marixanthomonas spongiae]|uniref:30S ribosomal protein S6--L-glutamate ligase n=1 Tax=Marixanthomonas spongiae TaxID=2174845 RepID=A0A2U0I2H7_9FLAO|nr:RimK family alpha-L-glutamate ligase [Marixanthomonas spongiae]PVW15307.1 30S ribosomal protein S6--L-glutamate ligase [Marixanthomonas spongiae]
MNIAILSRGYHLYSTQSLLKAGEKRNHAMEVLDPTYCRLSIQKGKPVLYYHEEQVDDLHAIIPRVGASNTYYGSSLVRHFEAMDVFSIVSAQAILHSRDKWTSFQILSKAGVAVPHTVFVNPYLATEQVATFGDNPIIIKLLEGTHGQGVILAKNGKQAMPIIETLQAAKQKFVLQEFIKESKGADIRVIVVDGVVIAAMKRHCKAGDFRSNLHRGGTSESLQLSHEEEAIALKAAKALKMGVCGVDILQSKRGPLVLEVNSTPGLEGIEKTTQKNISKSIIGYIERNKR